MTVFSYRALDSARNTVRGTIRGESPRHARELLRGQGLRVQDLQQQTKARSRERLSFSWPSGHQAQLTAFVSELSTLLAVGVPVMEALDTLVQQYKGRFRVALMIVRERVASGAGLAEAMAEQPRLFDHFTISMVEVGESSGTLDEVLERLARFKSRVQELKNKVVTALMYPLIVLGVSLCVAVFLMTYVVPMLLENLIDAQQQLPWPTMVLKSISDTLTQHGLWIALLIGAAILITALGWRTETGRRWWHQALIRMPLIGTMTVKQEVSRIALVIATLSRSGIPLLRAVEIAVRTTRNVVIREALQQSAAGITSGQDIGPALASSGVFPAMVVHIFSVGQKSGQLEPMLERLSEDYDRQVNTASARLAAVLEPMLIVVLSVFVGFILFATMLPILEAGNVL